MPNSIERPGFVWSSSAEEWEPIVLPQEDFDRLTFLYHKTYNGISFPIFRDHLGRYVSIDIE
jgi:hypothetical protein